MASQAELNRAREILKIEKELSGLRKGDLNVSFSATESLKELYNIRSKNTESERATLKNARDVNAALISTNKTFESIAALQRDVAKNQNIIKRSTELQDSIEKSIHGNRLRRVNNLISKQDSFLKRQEKITENEEKLIGLRGKERAALEKTIQIQKDTLNIDEEKYYNAVQLLGVNEKELLFSKIATKELKAQNDLRAEALQKIGPASQFLQVLGTIPGFSSIASEALTDLVDKTQQSIEKGEVNLNMFTSLIASLSAGVSAITSTFSLSLGFLAAAISSFNKINQQSVEFQRLTGETASLLQYATNDTLTSTVDRFETLTSLTRDFGFNAQRAFDSFNIQEATELRELMGLTAQTTNRLAFFAQATGDNLKTAAANAYEGVDAAFSQRELFEQIGTISDSIAITFDGNLELMVGTANEAKRLGLNLQQVDQIASGLLDIETSIANEFEAEVISGKQLNLERARFFALTNNLAGVTEEIGKNQEVINTFATGTRIEQEAIAGALNLSRDEVSRMIFDQSILNGMTEEEAGIRAGMNIEDAKRLTLQDQLAKSIEKISLVLAGPAAMFASMLENTFMLYTIMGSLATLSLAKLITQLITMATAATTAGIALNPATLGLIVAGVGITTGLIATAARKAGDAIIPAGRGPIISTREGGLIQGTANDDVIMAPGIARGGRNAGLSQADVAAIAKAVRDGASQAQINLDGGRVSNRLQPSLAVNTRKYSI